MIIWDHCAISESFPCFKPFGEPWSTPACSIGTQNEQRFSRQFGGFPTSARSFPMFQAFWGALGYPGVSNRDQKRAIPYLGLARSARSFPMFQAFWGALGYPGVSNRDQKRAIPYLRAILRSFPMFQAFWGSWGTPACPIGAIPYLRAILKAWPQAPGWPCGC